jgi:hypothetical protein
MDKEELLKCIKVREYSKNTEQYMFIEIGYMLLSIYYFKNHSTSVINFFPLVTKVYTSVEVQKQAWQTLDYNRVIITVSDRLTQITD